MYCFCYNYNIYINILISDLIINYNISENDLPNQCWQKCHHIIPFSTYSKTIYTDVCHVNLSRFQYGVDLSGMLGSYVRLGSLRVMFERSADSGQV